MMEPLEQPPIQQPLMESGHGFITFLETGSSIDFFGVFLQCRFDLALYQDSLFDTLSVHLPEEIRRACKKRKAEFLAGRYCAAQALKQLGFANVQVPIGPNRSPLWPTDISGSISHGGDIAICALTRGPLALGVDFELPIPTETAAEIKNTIVCTAEEIRFSQAGIAPEHWLTIAFSIKESLFKALYAKVQQYFDFLDAEILYIDPLAQKLTLTLTRDLCPDVRAGDLYHGIFQFQHNGVLTLIAPPH
ncbi:4'-phosphopantetheinyl transferase [Microbulbifer echini]|uniref:Enterobactin synthase component D n=1 Tax=Microbulbifer echini TaxID=1529067 RepID=A0ABV4NSY7_9GAMM|nr:4'-phosphopantetheinyl transferase superfamily protein [uncultured Microbulbifer sp.]